MILKGKVRVTTYNDEGEILESCVINQESGRYGVDILKNVWHGLECPEEQKNYEQPLAVEKLPLQNFYTAEEYHQDYLDKNPDGYCHLPLSLFEFARKARKKK